MFLVGINEYHYCYTIFKAMHLFRSIRFTILPIPYMFSRNRIYADGALALTLALQLGSCPNLKSLDLRGNKICVKGT